MKPTKSFSHLLVPVLKMGNDKLVASELARMPKRRSNRIGCGENPFACFKIIETKAFKTSDVIGQLTKSSMSPPMKGWDSKPRGGGDEFFGKKRTPPNGAFCSASDIVPNSQPISK